MDLSIMAILPNDHCKIRALVHVAGDPELVRIVDTDTPLCYQNIALFKSGLFQDGACRLNGDAVPGRATEISQGHFGLPIIPFPQVPSDLFIELGVPGATEMASAKTDGRPRVIIALIDLLEPFQGLRQVARLLEVTGLGCQAGIRIDLAGVV